MPNDFADRFVTLRSGIVMPIEPIRLALELEDRGIHLEADGDAVLASPKQLLTDTDRAAIRRWKYHVLALLAEGVGGVQ